MTHALRRRRRSAEQMAKFNGVMALIVADIQPCTVRQVFYQASVLEIVSKSESGYRQVQRALSQLRDRGRVPWGSIVDNTRMMRKPRSFNGYREALDHTAATYRKNIWAELDCYVEVWLEKDALSGVVYPIIDLYDVPLMVSRGYSSKSFLWGAAEAFSAAAAADKRCYAYHLGDFDPSGVDAARAIEEALHKLAPDAQVEFQRLAVLERQIRDWKLPTRPTKRTDARAEKFGSACSVELDAIHPDDLRRIVSDALDKHVPEDVLRTMKIAEESEAITLAMWANLINSHNPREEDEEEEFDAD